MLNKFNSFIKKLTIEWNTLSKFQILAIIGILLINPVLMSLLNEFVKAIPVSSISLGFVIICRFILIAGVTLIILSKSNIVLISFFIGHLVQAYLAVNRIDILTYYMVNALIIVIFNIMITNKPDFSYAKIFS